MKTNIKIKYINQDIFKNLKTIYENIDSYGVNNALIKLETLINQDKTPLILEIELNKKIYKIDLYSCIILIIRKFKKFIFIKLNLGLVFIYGPTPKSSIKGLYNYIRELMIENNINDVERFKIYQQLHIPNDFFETKL